MIRRFVVPFAAAIALSAAGADAISDARMEQLFRPLVGSKTVMSRDGRYLAYTEHARGETAIIVLELEHFTKVTRIIADEDRPVIHSKEKRPVELDFLAWADGNRLVFAPMPEREVQRGLDGIKIIERVFSPIQAVNADGSDPRELLESRALQAEIPSTNPGPSEGLPSGDDYYEPLLRVVGFPAGDRKHVFVEAPGRGSIATRLVQLDVVTGKWSELHNDFASGRLIYDWQGRPRLHWERDDANGTEGYVYRPTDSQRWRPLTRSGTGDAAHMTVTPETYFAPRAIPLGFDFDPNVLIYASNLGRDTFGVYGLDLRTQQRAPLSIEHPARDLAALDTQPPSHALVFDEWRQRFVGVRGDAPRPFTIWADTELGAVQRALEAQFPRRSVQLRAWDEARTRFLVDVTGGDPGRTFVYRKADDLAIELTRRAPWLGAAELHDTRFVEFPSANGATVSGWLTVPRSPRLNPPPAIVWLAGGFPPRAQAEFEPQAQVFADMGFVVLRLNNRGVLQLGTRSRDALRADPKGTSAADARAAVDWLAAHQRIDRKRIATFGEGFGGFLAIHAAEAQPDVFRCAVAFDPILNFTTWIAPPSVDENPMPDLDVVGPHPLIAAGALSFEERMKRQYFEGAGVKLGDLALQDDELGAPLFVAAREAETPAQMGLASGVAALRGRLHRRDIACTTVAYNEDFARGLPAARARLYRALEEFFNLNLYHYDVKIGPTRVVK